MHREIQNRKRSGSGWPGRFLGLGVFAAIAALISLYSLPLVHAEGSRPATDKNAATSPSGGGAGTASMAHATFAGGCFWCMEPPFENVPGVTAAISVYSGGEEPAPTYEQVSAGRTGHAEVVDIAYDPSRISYATLLEIFWRSIDPTDAGGQFADRGGQYRPGIFPRNAEQKRLAEASKAKLAAGGKFSRPIVVELVAFKSFHPAEEYHQDYYRKEPARYKRYLKGSGRRGFLE